MSEHWPPEWDDQDATDLDDEQSDSGQPDAGHLHPGLLAEHLAEVTSALASVPMPALPGAFAARISAAIAAEAATRTEHAGAIGVSATARSLSSAGSFPAAADDGTPTAPPARSRRAGARRGSRQPGTSRAAGPADARPPRRGRRRLVSVQGIGSLLVCLVIAGFGYLIFHNGTPSGSTMSSTYAEAAPAAASASSHAGSSAGRAASAPRPDQGDVSGHPGNSSSFPVRESGTRYEPATLAGQVRTALAATGGGSSPGAEASAAASASASSSSAFSAGGFLPSAALAGCVDSLTGGVTPSLVDRASYAGKPAYVIAVPSRAWVVGLGCTAASQRLITTIALAGLSGNLCALGSV